MPVIFITLSGPLTQQKKMLANKAMVDWQMRVKTHKFECEQDKDATTDTLPVLVPRGEDFDDIKTSNKKQQQQQCPYLEPDTQNVYRRTFYGYMGSHFGWEIGDGLLKGFHGSLDNVLQKLYADRHSEWVSFLNFVTQFNA